MPLFPQIIKTKLADGSKRQHYARAWRCVEHVNMGGAGLLPGLRLVVLGTAHGNPRPFAAAIEPHTRDDSLLCCEAY